MENPFKKFFKKKETGGYLISEGGEMEVTKGLTDEQRERFGLNESLLEPSQEDLELLFPSEDLKNIFQSMKAETFPPNVARNDKRAIVLETIKNHLISKENLSRGKTVYVGSGNDIEYPLILGARNIVLVDSGWPSEEEFTENVKQRIENILPGTIVNKDGNSLSFKIKTQEDILEKIEIVLETKHFGGGHHDTGKNAYESPDNISLLLSFSSGGYIDQDEKLLKGVIPGGYILPDRVSKTDDEMKNIGFDVVEYQTERIRNQKLFVKK